MQNTVVITGATGLIGSEAARHFHDRGLRIVGIDNDMRSRLYGAEASTEWNRRRLQTELANYVHVPADIRDESAMGKLFAELGADICLVIHTAAQPTHDWAARDRFTDFTKDANGTLVLLELCRRHCAEVPFILASTNKVYGDRPNELPLVERDTRWDLDSSHRFFPHGIDETMSIDQSKQGRCGASNVAADVLVQEYGRNFGMNTVCLRGGCLTGPAHGGTELHGFLAHLVKCTVTGEPYTVLGYGGKQVRDNIHSEDLVKAFWHVFRSPRSGEVYNIGGGRPSNCSMLEAIDKCQAVTGSKLNWTYDDTSRIGDHVWWISDTRRFEEHYPGWALDYDIDGILEEVYRFNRDRWREAS